jgi:ribosomal protein S18 acetylase RimI-like enzyme
MLKIKTLDEISPSEKNKFVNEVKEIFYLSSAVKSFKDAHHKDDFFEKWCGDYMRLYSESFYLLIDEKVNGNKTLGYLSGIKDSKNALINLRVPGLSLFEDLYSDFPAHLHINFHPDARGAGYGSILTEHYCGLLREMSIPGIHLVTSPEARNVSFYKKLNFNFESIRQLNSSKLLFLGKKLID